MTGKPRAHLPLQSSDAATSAGRGSPPPPQPPRKRSDARCPGAAHKRSDTLAALAAGIGPARIAVSTFHAALDLVAADLGIDL